MSENIIPEPLYKKTDHNTYICTITGDVCTRITKDLREYREFIQYLAATGDTRTFLTGPSNLCIGQGGFHNYHICNTWLAAEVGKELAEYEKNAAEYLDQKQRVEHCRQKVIQRIKQHEKL